MFFSNFAEAEVEPFHRGEIPHVTLVRFGVMHPLTNAPEWIDHTFLQTGLGRVRVRDVAAAVTKYFGVRLVHRAGARARPRAVRPTGVPRHALTARRLTRADARRRVQCQKKWREPEPCSVLSEHVVRGGCASLAHIHTLVPR